MIPQSRIPTTPHHPPGPNPPECFPLSVLSPAPSHPKKSRKHLKASKFEPSPRPYPILRLSSQACEISIPFLYRPDFSKSSLFLPSLVRTSSFCFLTQNRYGVPFPSLRPHRRRTACRPPRLFLFPFPASAGSQADGKWPFFCVPGSRLLSVYSSPPPECRPFRPLFALKTPRLPRPHLAACQSCPSLSHRLETVPFFSKIAAFSFFSGKTTKNLADSIEFFYSKFFQKAMLSPDNSWKSVAFSV